jgi:hypothetical protein
MTELHDFLVKCKDERHNRKLPSLKAVWEAGDLRPKLEGLNRGIVRVRTHWKVWQPPSETPADWRGWLNVTQERIDIRQLALLSTSKTETMDQLDHQNRMHTNTALTLVETIRAEVTEVIKVTQHPTVQTRARSLSIHSQVEPDGFKSLTTRVRHHVLAHASLTHTFLGRRRHNLARFLHYSIT